MWERECVCEGVERETKERENKTLKSSLVGLEIEEMFTKMESFSEIVNWNSGEDGMSGKKFNSNKIKIN